MKTTRKVLALLLALLITLSLSACGKDDDEAVLTTKKKTTTTTPAGSEIDIWEYLTLPHTVTRRSVLQKVPGRTLVVLPALVNTGFQVLFHSPPGVLFTFPSRYYTLSVTKSCLALEGGPPCFPQGSSCPVVLWILTIPCSLRLPGCHRLRPGFPAMFCSTFLKLCESATPKNRSSSVWAVPRSLAAT